MPKTVNVKTKHEAKKYSIEIRCGGLDDIGTWCRKILGANRKIAVVSNKKVFGLYGHRFSKSLAQAGFDTEVCMIGDGERFKDLKTFEKILDFLLEIQYFTNRCSDRFWRRCCRRRYKLCGICPFARRRLSFRTDNVAFDGRFVGRGKTGVNTDFGKNRVGTFFQPKGVMIDPEVLATLSAREVTAGFANVSNRERSQDEVCPGDGFRH
jgi:3-dehydroquinate synthase